MFKVGDSVVVKPATADPDFGINIGGWQGRISGMDAGKRGQISISMNHQIVEDYRAWFANR